MRSAPMPYKISASFIDISRTTIMISPMKTNSPRFIGRTGRSVRALSAPAGAPERQVRDAYARQLNRFRSQERLVAREARYQSSNHRADMRTVDALNVLREWEFKLHADVSAIGQLLRYVALCRRDQNYQRTVIGVLAAFDFAEDVVFTNASMNLGIELVRLPPWLRNAGFAPPSSAHPYSSIHIPLRNS